MQDPYTAQWLSHTTFVLDRDRTIYKIYNGWWFVGMDYRALLSRRADWWYDKKKPPYADQS